MRRLLSCLIVFSLLLTLVPNLNVSHTLAQSTNQGATFIANRFVKIGFDRDGFPLYPKRYVPWEKVGISWWGRLGYPMPNAYLARTDGINRVPGDTELVYPVMWTEVFLSIVPAGGKSQEYDKWYGILDSAGQLWLDPDGVFYDARYDPRSDPTSSYYIEGACRTNSNRQQGVSRYLVDPISDNNTQGPYILNPEHPLYDSNPIIFEAKGTRFGDRKWQLGYVDMVDYPPERVVYDADVTYTNKPNNENNIKFNPTTILPGQWDINLRMIPFHRTSSPTQGGPNMNDEMFHEYHARTRNTSYDPYEYIYRKGPGLYEDQRYYDPNPPSSFVQVGDLRLSDMSFKTFDGSTVVNYPANSMVRVGDADAPYDYNGNGVWDAEEKKALNFFASNIKHTETIEQNGYFDAMNRYGYTNFEFIYRDSNSNNIVDVGELRYSAVNTKLDIIKLDPAVDSAYGSHRQTLLNGNEPYTDNDFERTKITVDQNKFPYEYTDQLYRIGLGLVGWDAVTKAQGDLLLMSEVLRGGCESPAYDISVETDAWMGTDVGIGGGDKPLVPSLTAARLRSPNGDIVANSQRIQKNTVLDPNGNSFFIPASTFHNVKLNYREYIGVEIFKDNGIDNHLGVNLPQDNLYEQNLSDDYFDERMGEEFLGAVNAVNAKDYGLPLQPFPWDVRYYDSNDNGYGCGEAIYRIIDSPENTSFHIKVKAGDIRITGVTVTINNNDIVYPAGSTVAEGDADVGFGLKNFEPSLYYFYDKTNIEKDTPLNNTYDLGEFIYLNRLYNSNIKQFTQTYSKSIIKYVKVWQSNNHAAKTIPIYVDVNMNNYVDLNDVRLVQVKNTKIQNNYYPAFSKVLHGDSDINLPLTVIPQIGSIHYSWNDHRYDDAYIDINNNGYVDGSNYHSPSDNSDIRFTDVYGYLAGSSVYDKNNDGYWQNVVDVYLKDDRDVGDLNTDPTNNRNFFTNIGFDVGVTSDGVYFLDYNDSELGYLSSNDIQLNSLSVRSNYARLTEVRISDTYYPCGSLVSSGDFWYYQNPITRVPMGLNCDFRYFDASVQPGMLGVSIKMDQPLKVEQTTQIDISLITPLKRGQEAWILLQDVLSPNPNGGTINPDTVLKKLDYENQLATFQYTPYRGSCGELSTNYPLRVFVFKEEGGVKEPVPLDQYVDAFYAPFLAKDESGNVVNGNAPRPQSPPLPRELANSYDCYAELSYNVLPEDMKISSSKKCLDLLYKRFPNLTIRLTDMDNPNDVNDPANIRISIPNGESLIANYNAHGAGIDYLFTANPNSVQFLGDKGINEESQSIDTNYLKGRNKDKYIVQMNLDGTYYYWCWQDNNYNGVLDDEDLLAKSWSYPHDIDPELNQPVYNIGYDRLVWENSDCSEKNTCFTSANDMYKSMNEITRGDRFRIENTTKFVVETYGVPVLVTNYSEISEQDPGGETRIAVAPKDANSNLSLRVYLMNALYDYNSSIQHPPYFVYDSSPGIDYTGIKEFKVLPTDPSVNFTELRIIDHSLQNSDLNYTSGPNAVFPMAFPTPQIQNPYDPILKDVSRDFRAYPGGQTHFTRMVGMFDLNLYNGYPAIWNWSWYDDDLDYANFTDFNKLGTEFFPLTDYGIYFIPQNGIGENLSLRPDTPLDRRINRIIIKGPFIMPQITDLTTGKVTIELIKGNMINLPILYDHSGELIIDSTNYRFYEYSGMDWTQIIGFGPDTRYKSRRNALLSTKRDLDYTGLDNIIRVDEIIPVGAGILTITIEMADGSKKIYQDCCTEPPNEGIITHGLSIEGVPETLEINSDHKIEATLKEYTNFQKEQNCNNAYVYIWQDRGMRIHLDAHDVNLQMDLDIQFGMCDGYCMGIPIASGVYSMANISGNTAVQYPEQYDINKDGKISFKDYETEIMGTYDLASNTWVGGVVDARTFNVDGGKYIFDLSDSTGCKIVDMGADIGMMSAGATETQEMNMAEADHVVSKWEISPVYITAYKYGDDNNDRSFSSAPGGSSGEMNAILGSYSHEVYLAGQKMIIPTPIQDLSVSVSPSVLTAGCVPELVDPESPLTFRVTDSNGRGFDLTKGVDLGFLKGLPLRFRAEPQAIWDHLFYDPHPNPLPQYYWLRTDLHNNDNSTQCNERIFSLPSKPFRPINIDFTQASTGKYIFKNFIANDAGEFDVYVYSPDRTHMGIARVKVELPKVEYNIINTEDPLKTVHKVTDNPDFLLTAGDNRLYKITITARDARGMLIKGTTDGVVSCGGGSRNTARFTPYTTRPSSWDFSERDKFLFAQHFMQELYPYNINIGFDFNDNGKIDWKNSELFIYGGMNNFYRGMVYYNTTNVMYEDLSWEVTVNPNLPPISDPITHKPTPNNPGSPIRGENPQFASVGWGLGSIYNNPYHGGYLFADIDKNGALDFHDSLGLDVNGQTTFYIFAEDLAYIGGLVGQNAYCNNASEADLAGNPPPSKTDPRYVDKRFNPLYSHDGVFFLDWEAFGDTEVTIAPPQLKVLDAETRIELDKDLLNKNNYDLVYSIENHMIVQVTPADPRDLPMREDGRVFLFGNQHQTAIYGNIKASQKDPKIMETTIHFTPTGLGEAIASIGFYNPNHSYLKQPYDLKNTSTYVLMDLLKLDSNLGLYLEVFTDGPVVVNMNNEIMVRVKEIGTMFPVEGARVKIEGAGVSGTKTTDKSGTVVFPIKANQVGIIKVEATKENRVIGRKEIRVIEDLSRPFIELDPLPPYTNKSEVTVTGITNPGNTVLINGSINATVDDNGHFSAKVTLKEGLNTIIAEAKNSKGDAVKASISITLDTTPPDIFIDDPGYLVDVSEIEVTGRTEPYSTVKVNGNPVTLTHDIFKGIIKVNLGKNTITVESTDLAGNNSIKTRDIYVYHRITMKLTIDNPVITINDQPQPPLEYPPFILQGRTLVPVRIISEGIGANVEWNAAAKTVTITLGSKTIVMTIDKKEVFVNGKQVLLDAPAVIRNGRTFVPLRFISEVFGAEVSWDQVTRTVTVVFDK